MQIPNQGNRRSVGANMTPMIDVVFLLIVFFMVVAQQMSEQYVPMENLAIASNAPVPEQPPPSGACKMRGSRPTRSFAAGVS